MRKIFEQGSFHSYSKLRLDEAMGPVMESATIYSQRKTTVFVSHKHDDLSDLKDILGFFESTYGVLTYIDSRDPSMPKVTSAETATNIKKRIKQCDKFILLATNGAIESKWCNWELGFGDANKYQEHIALFPIKPKGSYDYEYKGSEYMRIYPYIAFFDGTESYSNGQPIPRGYYVRTESADTNYITPLGEWLSKRT